MARLSPHTIQKITALCEAHPALVAELFQVCDDQTCRMIEEVQRDANDDQSSFVCAWDYQQQAKAQDFIERCRAIATDIEHLQLVEA